MTARITDHIAFITERDGTDTRLAEGTRYECLRALADRLEYELVYRCPDCNRRDGLGHRLSCPGDCCCLVRTPNDWVPLTGYVRPITTEDL